MHIDLFFLHNFVLFSNKIGPLTLLFLDHFPRFLPLSKHLPLSTHSLAPFSLSFDKFLSDFFGGVNFPGQCSTLGESQTPHLTGC